MELDLINVCFEAWQNVNRRKNFYFEQWVDSDFKEESLHKLYLQLKEKEEQYCHFYSELVAMNNYQKELIFDKIAYGYYLQK